MKLDHSPPNNAVVKDTWIYTSTLPYVFVVQCLIIQNRDNVFTIKMGQIVNKSETELVAK
jgi:hypothetical protein